MVKILAFESSCDETAVALYNSENNTLEHVLHSQISLHAQYGGVVPELASRSHIEHILPLAQTLVEKVGITSLDEIDCVAYTKGPGLVGTLLVAACFANSLGIVLDKPVIGVHHLAAHVTISQYIYPQLKPPYLSLLVSGGHTMLLLTHSACNHEILGQTLDDAAGEAFDKGAKILDLGYPGGPIISQYAKKSQGVSLPSLPIPMFHHSGLDMSFSGLKTAFSQQWQQEEQSLTKKYDYAKALEMAISATLIRKLQGAMKQYNGIPLVVAGGVAANTYLRSEVKRVCDEHSIEVYFPPIEYCTDNAAMIAYQAYLQLSSKYVADRTLVSPRWPLSSLAKSE